MNYLKTKEWIVNYLETKEWIVNYLETKEWIVNSLDLNEKFNSQDWLDFQVSLFLGLWFYTHYLTKTFFQA